MALERDDEINNVADWIKYKLKSHINDHCEKTDFKQPFRIKIHVEFDGEDTCITNRVYNYKEK